MCSLTFRFLWVRSGDEKMIPYLLKHSPSVSKPFVFLMLGEAIVSLLV